LFLAHYYQYILSPVNQDVARQIPSIPIVYGMIDLAKGYPSSSLSLYTAYLASVTRAILEHGQSMYTSRWKEGPYQLYGARPEGVAPALKLNG
jgi:hypothetical protein